MSYPSLGRERLQKLIKSVKKGQDSLPHPLLQALNLNWKTALVRFSA